MPPSTPRQRAGPNLGCGGGRDLNSSQTNSSEALSAVDFPHRPFGLLAELTYRCPLHCPYCSNPVELANISSELTTEEWKRVIDEASNLGVLHILFSGGEPLLRKDLPELVAAARNAGL